MARSHRSPDITPDLLLRAYSVGLFPMAESAEDERLFWVDPEQRGVFPLARLTISRSLGKTIRSDRFTVVADGDFDAVIEGCAAPALGRPTTWISRHIRSLFRQLYERSEVHTIEAYREGRLVGGLYGLQIGAAFFGESMFHRETDASKVCLAHLAARLIAGGFRLLDTQFITPHLASLGAVEVPKARYRAMLADAVQRPARFDALPAEAIEGSRVLGILEAARSE